MCLLGTKALESKLTHYLLIASNAFGYEHTSKFCKIEKNSCSHCAGDHEKSNCEKIHQSEAVQCVNYLNPARFKQLLTSLCVFPNLFSVIIKRIHERTKYGV